MKSAKPWKAEFGKTFGEADSMEGGNYAFFYPILEKLGVLRPGLCVFSIGGGFGTLEFHLAKNLGAKIGFLDPSPSLFEMFEEKFRNGHLESQIVEKKLAPFQTFESNQKYDLIVAIHSWYYVGCDEACLRKALAMLKPGGTLFIALSHRVTGIQNIVNYLTPPEEENFHFEDLSEWADKIGLAHEKHRYDFGVPAVRYFKDGKLTDNGRSWIAYMNRKQTSEVSDETITNVHRLVDENTTSGEIPGAWGALVFRR